jgi:chromosome segregation ATPase
MIARLEEQLEMERRTLDEGIKLILDTHVAVANGDLSVRAPLTQNNVLWQIARSLNMLLDRLQRASRAERELQRVTQAINSTVQTIQHATQSNQTLSLPLTQVPEIDPLIVEIQGKTFSYAPSIFGSRASHIPDETQLHFDDDPYSQRR